MRTWRSASGGNRCSCPSRSRLEEPGTRRSACAYCERAPPPEHGQSPSLQWAFVLPAPGSRAQLLWRAAGPTLRSAWVPCAAPPPCPLPTAGVPAAVQAQGQSLTARRAGHGPNRCTGRQGPRPILMPVPAPPPRDFHAGAPLLPLVAVFSIQQFGVMRRRAIRKARVEGGKLLALSSL